MAYRLGKLKDKLCVLLSAYDSKCMACGVDVFDGVLGLCPKCFAACTPNNGKKCLRCGVAIDTEEDFCGTCNFSKVYFEKAHSAFVYEGKIEKVIRSVKFGGMGIYCRMLANYLVYLAKTEDVQFDTVCYVPMTAKKQRERGYNQARLLAEYFCDIIDEDCLSHCLTKIRDTAAQEKLSRRERIENVKNAYEAKNDKQIKGKTVVLIDDVKTTGSTLNECAKALKKAGAEKVVCLTVAARKRSLQVQQGEQDGTDF